MHKRTYGSFSSWLGDNHDVPSDQYTASPCPAQKRPMTHFTFNSNYSSGANHITSPFAADCIFTSTHFPRSKITSNIDTDSTLDLPYLPNTELPSDPILFNSLDFEGNTTFQPNFFDTPFNARISVGQVDLCDSRSRSNCGTSASSPEVPANTDIFNVPELPFTPLGLSTPAPGISPDESNESTLLSPGMLPHMSDGFLDRLHSHDETAKVNFSNVESFFHGSSEITVNLEAYAKQAGLYWSHKSIENLVAFAQLIAKDNQQLQTPTSRNGVRNPNPMTAPETPKKSTSAKWWSRFNFITTASDIALPNSIAALISAELRPEDILGNLGHQAIPSWSEEVSYHQLGRVLYMLKPEASGELTDLFLIIHYMFVFLACEAHGPAQTLRHNSNRNRKLFDWDLVDLHSQWDRDFGGLKSMDFGEFKAHVGRCRKWGSKLVYLGQRFGPGSLLHISPTLRELAGCTKGQEGGIGAEAREKAFARFEAVGLRQAGEESGAGKLVNNLLWSLFEGWDCEFGRRGDDEARMFPAFANI